MIALPIIYIPLLALVWSTVVFGVRWARTGRQPPRFMNPTLRRQPQVLPAAVAGLMTWNFVMIPNMPWHHALTHRLTASAWEWWGAFVAAMVLPVVVVLLLTGSVGSAPVRDADASR